MSYVKATNFAVKDVLPTGDPNKIVRGTEIDTEFNALQNSIGLLAPKADPSFTGTAIFNAITAASATINGTTIPASATLVTTAATQTLTNKTLTTPVINTSITGTAVTQTATDTTANRLLKVGDYGAGAAAGTLLFGRANILGTVSQSAGVPTGAVIQRGSNANGEFVRYADGTQICILPSKDITLSIAQGSLWRGVESVTFPQTFASTPLVNLMINFPSSTGAVALRNSWANSSTAITTTGADIRAIGVDQDVVVSVRTFVIGRWF